MQKSKECDYKLTIEKRLKKYTESSFATERHEILWHAWKHNQRWLKQLLEWIMPSFPIYSRHGESHAQAILHSIEMVLGEDQIEKLSASDCFLILHVVYIHDIGMCITHADRAELMNNNEFLQFLKEVKNNGDVTMRKYAEALLTYCSDMPKADSQEELLKVKLDVYYAIMYMIAEYRRKDHGNQSAQLLNDWIDKPENLGIGFSTSGIPSRFFYTIGACAGVHTSYDFEDVMALHKEDTGFAHDYMHPRFAAVLLQLGDALDLDNDRFHPLVKQFMGEIPHTSEVHFGKHKAIRRLRISPNKITIEADCENAEILRLVNNECECIRNILKEATYRWSAICPSELSVCLPVFEPVKLLMNGQNINQKLVNVRFKIQQKKAFNLLQGNNIYKDDTFVFLREIFQNAIDASKLQYWIDWKGSRWYSEDCEYMEPAEMGKRLSPISYPIEVELHLAKMERYGTECILVSENNELCADNAESNEYGILVRIIDHGIGMTARDIETIANVGTSYEQRKDVVDRMPKWLGPTAEFGIGLQSVFLTSDFMTAYTHPRTNEKYKITFQATGDKGEGFIGVTPLKEDDAPKAFGTIFEVFVPNTKKKKHQDDLESWCGKDPFEKNYQEYRDIRHSRELMLQLAIYLDSLIGEKLFPVRLRMYDIKSTYDLEDEIFTKKISGKLQNTEWEYLRNDKVENSRSKVQNENSVNELEQELNNITWIYGLANAEHLITGKVKNNYLYAFDCRKIKLYLWNSKSHVYARFGADRLQVLREIAKHSKHDEKESETQIFYKGVYTKSISWDEDANLLECIDIKGKLNRDYLAINRAEFTESGYKYIQNEIYPSVLKAAHEALEACNKNEQLFEKIIKGIGELKDNQKSKEKDIQKAIISAIGLATYAQIQSTATYLAPNGKKSCERWNKLLKELSIMIEEEKRNRKRSWIVSTFFSLPIHNKKEHAFVQTEESNIAGIMREIHRYAIISKRNHRSGAWEKYLICIDADNHGGKKQQIKEQIMELKTQWDMEKRADLIKSIEQWGKESILKFSDTLSNMFYKNSFNSKVLAQNAIFNWILENIPSVAMFSNEDNSLRINLLDLEHTDSMYFDINSKWSIYERMLETYEITHINRFSMVANTGYCQLAFQDNPPSVFFVKRGSFSKIGQRYNIFPLTGEVLKELYKNIEKWDINSPRNDLYNELLFFTRFEKYVQKIISEFVENSQRIREQQLYRKLEEMIGIYGFVAHQYICDRFIQKLEEIMKIDSCMYLAESENFIDDNSFLEILNWTLDIDNLNENIESLLSTVVSMYNKIYRRDKMIPSDKKQFLKNMLLEACELEKKGVLCEEELPV